MGFYQRMQAELDRLEGVAMGDKRGVKETVEAVTAGFDTAIKIIEIRKEGVAGLPKLASLYGEVQTAIQGGDQIPAEMKDLDAEETKALIKLTLLKTNDLLTALGANTAGPLLMVVAEAVEAGEQTYTTWKPIIEKLQALRAVRADVQ